MGYLQKSLIIFTLDFFSVVEIFDTYELNKQPEKKRKIVTLACKQ